jgi:acyl carrier protein
VKGLAIRAAAQFHSAGVVSCRTGPHLYNALTHNSNRKLKFMSDKASLMQQPAPLTDVGLQRELAALFVQALNLEVKPQDIDPDAPLYGEGLGLDSIDILEVALIVSKQYGIHLRADSQENQQIFRSLRHLAEYIAAQRTK